MSFSSLIRESLVGKGGLHLDDGIQASFVRGKVNLSHDGIITQKNAFCTFTVFANWAQRLPIVHCQEPWIIKDSDWHVGDAGWVCYELPERWVAEVEKVAQTEGQISASRYAVTWCVESVKWLLYRHYYASTVGLRKWPEGWPQWRHGAKGRGDYLAGTK